MKGNLKKLLICLAVPLSAGGLSLWVSGGTSDYETLNQPPLSPPGWVFSLVWPILYLLMGYASFRVLVSGGDREELQKALGFYAVQLLLNFLWPIVFFSFAAYLSAFFLLLILWVFIFITQQLFQRLDLVAANLLIPYLLWVIFAGYLNLGIFLLN